ncbi:MAG: hypothetical protein J6P13_07620 [Kiritimatiellae bacterium]|nr:hypothetical protein [Kiritimatiellia bacterium]
MKRKLLSMLAIVLVATAALPTMADLTEKDSSQFEYKYEMFKKPTDAAEDQDGGKAADFSGENDKTPWCTLGTGADVGTMTMDMSTGNKSLTSDKTNGTAGDIWKSMGATHQTGYTVEVRLKVLEVTGSAGAFFLNTSLPGGKYNCFLYFFSDQLKWGSAKVADISTADWHTYRVVRLANSEKYHLYIDGSLVDGNLGNAYNGELNRMIFGAGGGNYKSKIKVAYLRLANAPYAPVNVKANRMRSDEFDVKYEMNDGDTVGAVAGTTSDWKTTIDSRGGGVSKAGGVLSVVAGGYHAYWDTTDTAWKKLVSATTPYTVEFNIKVDSSDENDRSINMTTGSAGAVGNLFVGANSVQWSPDMTKKKETFVTLDTSDNTDKFHTFRIAYDGATRHGFTVWRDGKVIGEYLVDCTNYYNFSNNALGIVRFGKAGVFNDGTFHVNYVRWKIGGVYPPDNRQSLFIILR